VAAPLEAEAVHLRLRRRQQQTRASHFRSALESHFSPAKEEAAEHPSLTTVYTAATQPLNVVANANSLIFSLSQQQTKAPIFFSLESQQKKHENSKKICTQRAAYSCIGKTTVF
jgi:hypothetical protein